MTIRSVSLTEGKTQQLWDLNSNVYRRFVAGSLVEERSFDAADTVWQSAIQALDALDSGTLLPKLRTALTTNRTYLDKVAAGTATNTDHSVQVAALTRQVTAVLLKTMLETG